MMKPTRVLLLLLIFQTGPTKAPKLVNMPQKVSNRIEATQLVLCFLAGRDSVGGDQDEGRHRERRHRHQSKTQLGLGWNSQILN